MKIPLLAICALMSLAATLRSEPLEIERHWAIYLPESDEVEFHVRFNKEPLFPPNFLQFDIMASEEDPRLITTVGGMSLRDRGELDVVFQHIWFPADAELIGTFPYDVNGTVFSAFIPFDALRADRFEFDYTVVAHDDPQFPSGGFGRAFYAVPEPTAFASIVSALICAGGVSLRCRRKRIR
jgi:hypothetical protein